jgi:hypothetical protein
MLIPRTIVPELSVPTLAHGKYDLAAERPERLAKKVGSVDLRFGYELSLATARTWGLYISTSRGVTSIGIEEPVRFSEPGMFLVAPDRTLFYGAVQTMPFARPPPSMNC